MFRPRWARMVWGATIAGVVAFVACSFCPMWQAYPADPLRTSAGNCTLWRMLLAVNDPEMVVYWEDGVVNTAIAVHTAAIVGALIGATRWKRKPTGDV